ncbi:thiamine-phosphate kinase [Panacagrimonas sp.]|uniref:thiamine-phosphate kinase n=1 Tax=Panacagrimonas sp. TaxID=2480088 RepID=UPI003B519604
MDEFALIRRYFTQLSAPRADVLLGIGDDCALLQPPPGEVLAVTTDTLICGRHFSADVAPYDLGWKALAVSLSDLAAMGAQPRWFTLALSLQKPCDDWLDAFACGMARLAATHDVALVGGDTTQGPLSLNVTAFGTVAAGQAVTRSGARVGDAICVSGTLGDAALALHQRQRDGEADAALALRLDRPEPRVALGLTMAGHAHAAVDLSDGLAGDLGHVLQASGMGALIDLHSLPASEAMIRALPAWRDRLPFQLSGGDDYELCLCLPPSRLAALRAHAKLPLTRIGTITAETGLRGVDLEGATMDIPAQGYRHFA